MSKKKCFELSNVDLLLIGGERENNMFLPKTLIHLCTSWKKTIYMHYYIVEENIFAIVVWKILEQILLIGHVKDYFQMDGKVMIKMSKKCEYVRFKNYERKTKSPV